jgi:hypothetical protein
MVAEQRETVQRIDADTVDIANNVAGAQRELLKYYSSISSNRWLMLKVFGVLIVFVSVYFSIMCELELTVDVVPCVHSRFVDEVGSCVYSLSFLRIGFCSSYLSPVCVDVSLNMDNSFLFSESWT